METRTSTHKRAMKNKIERKKRKKKINNIDLVTIADVGDIAKSGHLHNQVVVAADADRYYPI